MIEARVAGSGMAHLAGRRVVLTGGASQLSGCRNWRAPFSTDSRASVSQCGFRPPEAAAGPSLRHVQGFELCRASTCRRALVTENAGGPFGRLAAWLRRNF